MSKVVIPRLLETLPVFRDDLEDSIHLMGREACVAGDTEIPQPHFQLLSVLQDVNMWRLADLLRVEKKTMSFPKKECRHARYSLTFFFKPLATLFSSFTSPKASGKFLRASGSLIFSLAK
jgi:hypothetical protein